jgi:hypothetical protein
MFVIGRIFDREDVLNIGKVALWISIPMTVLIALQFYSPQSAWVNRGIGGSMEGAGFSGALGFFRPPGTFSFTNGNTLFYSFVSCYVIYFWLNPKSFNLLILSAATVGVLAAIPFSISRGLLFQVALSVLFAISAIARNPKYLGKMLMAIMGGLVVLVVLSQVSVLQTPIKAFTERIGTASEQEGGLEGTLGDRFLGGMLTALTHSSGQPFFGYGIGMGTNVGSMLLTGDRVFLISEEEWGRLIGELGPLMGLIAIFIRIGLALKIALASNKKLAKGDILPWMLMSFGLINLLQAQWAQPTALGFSTLIGGLMIASLRIQRK